MLELRHADLQQIVASRLHRDADHKNAAGDTLFVSSGSDSGADELVVLNTGTVAPVPEPTSLSLFLAGVSVASVLPFRRRKTTRFIDAVVQS